MKPDIVLITQNPRLINGAFKKKLAALGRLTDVKKFAGLSEKKQCALLSENDIVVTGWGPCLLPPFSTLSPDRKLKYICHLTGEMKRVIPFEYIKKGIKVTNWGSGFSSATAEGAVSLVLAVIKDLVTLDRSVRRGQTRKPDRRVLTLCGARVGLYGYGFIGKLTARMLRTFSPVLSFYDPTVKKWPVWIKRCRTLQELFRNNEVVSVHAGLNDATIGSVTEKELMLMPEGGIFVNTARGKIVREKDLAAVLKSGRLYAGIDVITDESDWKNSPLAKTPNTLLTGHSISNTGRWEMVKLQQIALDNITAFIKGRRTQYNVTPLRYQRMT